MTPSMTDLARMTECMAAFPTDVIGQMVLASTDLCLLVGDDLTVLDIVVGYALRDLDCASWHGASLRTLVGAEGQSKIDQLWLGTEPARATWRHLNFRVRAMRGDVPLLVQRIAAHDGRSVLVCRDLRPTVRMQQQFNNAVIEIERGYEGALLDDFDTMTHNAPGRRGFAATCGNGRGSDTAQASALVRQAFDDLGSQPLSQIVSKTALVLEEMCIRKAYAQAGYDLDQTARVLNMDADNLAQRLAFFQTRV